jgi:hypothetical protein
VDDVDMDARLDALLDQDSKSVRSGTLTDLLKLVWQDKNHQRWVRVLQAMLHTKKPATFHRR